MLIKHKKKHSNINNTVCSLYLYLMCIRNTPITQRHNHQIGRWDCDLFRLRSNLLQSSKCLFEYLNPIPIYFYTKISIFRRVFSQKSRRECSNSTFLPHTLISELHCCSLCPLRLFQNIFEQFVFSNPCTSDSSFVLDSNREDPGD